jgi:hypothetical protein
MRKLPLIIVIVGIVAVAGMVLAAMNRARQDSDLENWEPDPPESLGV